MFRSIELAAKDIDVMFRSYNGKSLDVILVDLNSNHRTPEETRSWNDTDTVRLWEVDVTYHFYDTSSRSITNSLLATMYSGV